MCTYHKIINLLCIFSKYHVHKNINILNTKYDVVLYDKYPTPITGVQLVLYNTVIYITLLYNFNSLICGLQTS